MANLTLERVLDALKTIVETVDDLGVVLTDSRFVEDEKEILDLITGVHPTSEPTGILITWQSIPSQVRDENPCLVITTYRFTLNILRKYEHKRDDGLTSDAYFKRKLFELNEKLNSSPDLGLDERVEHQCLISSDEFGVVAWGEGHGAPITHLSNFELDVEVTNGY